MHAHIHTHTTFPSCSEYCVSLITFESNDTNFDLTFFFKYNMPGWCSGKESA